MNVDSKAEILASLMGDVLVTYGGRVQFSFCPDSSHLISVKTVFERRRLNMNTLNIILLVIGILILILGIITNFIPRFCFSVNPIL